jgi:hypothetical protein
MNAGDGGIARCRGGRVLDVVGGLRVAWWPACPGTPMSSTSATSSGLGDHGVALGRMLAILVITMRQERQEYGRERHSLTR